MNDTELCFVFFIVFPGAAGVLVGHPFDTVKVGVSSVAYKNMH